MDKIKTLLGKQLKIEQKSINLYTSFIKKISDKGIKNKIRQIRDDEKEHADLVKKMVSLIS